MYIFKQNRRRHRCRRRQLYALFKTIFAHLVHVMVERAFVS